MAAHRGQSPDEFLLAIVDREVRARDKASVAKEETAPTYDPQRDPLARFMGIFASDEPGWADRHEEYLAKAYEETHEDE
jgi:hypothetical protein